MTKIEYLGYIIDADGLHPIEEKVKAIKNAPQPKNVTELRSFLGILNYVLWEVLTVIIFKVGTFVSTITQTNPMDVGSAAAAGIQPSQNRTADGFTTGTL